ncbi:MAG TPA: 16S rRNA (cytidine(1402)-2'-O)-methyltransferase [Chloroflexi bacterium]|nr:16S rRNA (cytidine(1402)-2'-O)-methyltransferase [Chloroflexota bacterium]
MGTLYLVGTPIGNLEDMTLRALRTLRESHLIAAEDTRRAAILTRHYEIETPVTSYFEGNKLTKLDTILGTLETGDVALISEAGMPGLSDPGYELVSMAIDRGYPVTAIPGPSAPIMALVVSGLPTDRFLYLGFLPRQPNERQRFLSAVARAPYTLIFFESPYRLRESLADMARVLGGERSMVIGREMTKLHEEIWRGTIAEAQAHFDAVEARGEFTLVVDGASEDAAEWEEEQVRAEFDVLLSQGMKRSDAARHIAALSGWKRSDVYVLGLKDEA